ERRIDGVQACNPPDIFFLHGLLARLRGATFVFDQHALAPELYETRFGRRGLIHRILRLCERLTYRAADRVVATNDSYKAAAIERGRLRPDRVVVVRNGPDPDTMRPGPVDEDLRSGRDHLVVWMGNMGPQDGVDDALRAVAHLVHELDRHDCSFAFIGQGEVLEDLRQMACDLDIEAFVTFTGWIPDCDAFALLSSATIGLSADPPGPLNDKSTMNKTLEYMAFGLPVVAHDLAETRVSAGDAALYASTPDPKGLALAVDQLLDDPRRRQEMGQTGRDRIECGLSWSHQEEAYTRLWAELVGLPPLDPPSRV
ncbi:MAG: glycosyltransferase family 4 protein, partial [Actinomycetia bacterium]|nr:glycosyltransferase family 4 protein [Actinomycetes bacterium]